MYSRVLASGLVCSASRSRTWPPIMPSMVPVAWAISSMMRTRASAATLQARQHFVGVGLQRVTGENGGGLAESDVASGTSAAKIVVIERRQIVMDQRIGVQHFDGRAQIGDARRQPTRRVAGRGQRRPCAPLPCKGSAEAACRRQRRCGAWRGESKADTACPAEEGAQAPHRRPAGPDEECL